MRSLTLHLKLLILFLLAAGFGVIAYQVYVLHIPLTPRQTNDVWNIDAKIQFTASGTAPVKLQMYVPPLDGSFESQSESFIAKDYGSTFSKTDGNRRVTLSARRASGKQTLYYRLVVNRRLKTDVTEPPAPEYRESLLLEGAEKAAADAIIASVRQHSADVETFISETIKRVNSNVDDNVKLLTAKSDTVLNRARVIDLLLSQAHIPLEMVHTLRLQNGQNQNPELWLRSHNGKKWLYFNAVTGEQGMPDDRIIWWVGDNPLYQLDGGRNMQVSVALSNSEVNTLHLTSGLMEYSLYSLPLSAQDAFQVMMMIPAGVLVILIFRNIIGFMTLGTFTPVLIALAFRETGLQWGIILFTVITSMGLLLRSYLEHLKLQMLPRLSVVLSFVVIIIGVISVFSLKLGFDSGLSVALFPMVILTMSIERLSISWEERGASAAIRAGIGTLFAASLAYGVMQIPELMYFVFTFPGVILVLMAFMLAMGRYRGYRLTELFRFKTFTQD